MGGRLIVTAGLATGLMVGAAIVLISLLAVHGATKVPAAQADSTAKTAFSFAAMTPAAGTISASQAATTARRYSQAISGNSVLPAGVTESVYYGQFSDESFSSRPVWLVAYTGSGVHVTLGDGPAPPPGTHAVASGPVAHEEAVVIDATTGQFLEEEMASNLPSMPATAVLSNQGS